MKKEIVITCEHGGKEIPLPYRCFFKGKENLLSSHRGWDPGALEIAKHIAAVVGCNLVFEKISRLLIEQNRSPESRTLYSEISKPFTDEMKEKLFSDIYMKYHCRVENAIRESIERGGRVYHFSIHSFTPVLNGAVRSADIGILYDPSREMESEIGRYMRKKLGGDGYVVRRNYPYRGISDGVTRWLRGKYGGEAYSGIEVEINQRFYDGGGGEWERLVESVGECVGEFSTGGNL